MGGSGEQVSRTERKKNKKEEQQKTEGSQNDPIMFDSSFVPNQKFKFSSNDDQSGMSHVWRSMWNGFAEEKIQNEARLGLGRVGIEYFFV